MRRQQLLFPPRVIPLNLRESTCFAALPPDEAIPGLVAVSTRVRSYFHAIKFQHVTGIEPLATSNA